MSLHEFPRLATFCLMALFALVGCDGDDPDSSSTDPCQGRCLSNQVCDQGQCVACTSNLHCTSAAAPICRLADNVCVQCVGDSQCGQGLVCQNAQCVLDSEPSENCFDDEDCDGSAVCIDATCQVCRIGSCNAAGTARCQAETMGGPTSWSLCASGECQDGTCTDVPPDWECTPGSCHSESARCTNEGKIEGCRTGETCGSNLCKNPTLETDCIPNQCANSDARCSSAGEIIECASGNYCSENTCIRYCGDGIINNGEACDGSNLNGKSCETLSGSSFTGGTLSCSSSCTFNTSSCTSGQQSGGIQAARDAAKAAGNTETTVNISISNAVVTYVRAQIGNDVAGFFIQEGASGPAIFVNSSGGTASPSAGDRISLTATEVLMSEVARITAYSGYSKTGSNVLLSSYRQDISEKTDITDIDKYESELIEALVTLTGDFDSLGSAGTGFEKAPIKTDGYTPATPSRDFVLRIPTAIATTIETKAATLSKKVTGCEIYFYGMYWGYTTSTHSDTQLTIYDQNDDFIVDCENADDLPPSLDHKEAWNGLSTTTSASTGTFASTDLPGITWSYNARTIGETTNNMAFTRGVVMDNNNGRHLTSPTLSHGIGNLSIQFGKGSSGTGTRCIKVTIGDDVYKSPAFSGNTFMTFLIENINAPKDSSFKIEMNTSTNDGCAGTQLMIGEIEWSNKS